MPKVKKTCRVCGRPYDACRTTSRILGAFNWRDVACSPACGAVYLQRLNESRGIATDESVEESHEVQEARDDANNIAQPEVDCVQTVTGECPCVVDDDGFVDKVDQGTKATEASEQGHDVLEHAKWPAKRKRASGMRVTLDAEADADSELD